jgi:hypothetical protein
VVAAAGVDDMRADDAEANGDCSHFLRIADYFPKQS